MLKRKNIILSFFIAVLALISLIVLCLLSKSAHLFPIWVGLIVAIVIFEASNIVAAKTCRCPHCGAGGRFTSKIRFSIKMMSGQITTVTCPECGKEIEIK